MRNTCEGKEGDGTLCGTDKKWKRKEAEERKEKTTLSAFLLQEINYSELRDIRKSITFMKHPKWLLHTDRKVISHCHFFFFKWYIQQCSPTINYSLVQSKIKYTSENGVLLYRLFNQALHRRVETKVVRKEVHLQEEIWWVLALGEAGNMDLLLLQVQIWPNSCNGVWEFLKVI